MPGLCILSYIHIRNSIFNENNIRNDIAGKPVYASISTCLERSSQSITERHRDHRRVCMSRLHQTRQEGHRQTSAHNRDHSEAQRDSGERAHWQPEVAPVARPDIVCRGKATGVASFYKHHRRHFQAARSVTDNHWQQHIEACHTRTGLQSCGGGKRWHQTGRTAIGRRARN